MQRRTRAGGEPAKAQRRKTGPRKSRATLKAVRPRRSSAAREETKLALVTRERDEALQRQAATTDENAGLRNELRESLQQKSPPRMCLISSAGQLSICRRYSTRWSSLRLVYARLIRV
jgi:hypothetical protein